MTTPSEQRTAARTRTVEEHIRCENARDVDGVLTTFGDRAQYDEEAWDEHYSGHDEVRSYYERLFQASADLRIDIRRQHISEEAIILEVLLTGTHTGSWRGLPATCRRIHLPLCAIYTFDEHDKLSGERIYYDRATVLRQLGVFREPTTLSGRLSTLVGHPLTMLRTALRFGKHASVTSEPDAKEGKPVPQERAQHTTER